MSLAGRDDDEVLAGSCQTPAINESGLLPWCHVPHLLNSAVRMTDSERRGERKWASAGLDASQIILLIQKQLC